MRPAHRVPAPGRTADRRRALTALAALSLLAATAAAVPTTPPRAVPKAPPTRPVVVARLDCIIHPVAAQFVAKAVARADAAHAAALVLEIDTPGGLMSSMSDIIRSVLQARTPVVVWVGPQGSRAASAGFFILMAADVAAMAPGTHTGAAHPVGAQGEDLGRTMRKKVEEDAAAQIRSLASGHGRNVELAQTAVIDSRSFTADEALKGKLVEVLAPDVPSLLRALDGRTITKGERPPVRLATAGAAIDEIDMGRVQRFLAVLIHPNIAFLLLAAGMVGIYFEIATPGAVVPGVVGAICLVLGLYAMSVLPVSYAGVGLLMLAAVFFLAEIKVTSYGLLTTAGTICLVLGSLMLFETPEPALRVSRSIIAGVTASVVVATVFLMTLVVRTHRTQVTTGSEGLVGERGVARTALTPGGRVYVRGELWRAEAEGNAAAGTAVEVVQVDGMTLRVRPLAEASSMPPPAPTAGG
jgi:membrane-bound serine protease (ClpP class)